MVRLLQVGEGKMPCRAMQKLKRQERLHVEVRLAAADVGDRSRIHRRQTRCGA